MTTAQKRTYLAPELTCISTTPMQMLAASGDPDVSTTDAPASADYEILVKENQGNGFWDSDWDD